VSSPAKPESRLWIGPSGWSYPDWNGFIYPRPRPRGFRPLAYIAQFLNAVEINSSFYAIPAPRTTAAWPPQTPATFRFAYKLHRDFTHAAQVPGKRVAAAVLASLAPLAESGKLGPLLIQFPWSFRFTPAAVDRLGLLAEYFADFERFIEVRHMSWATPEAVDAIRAAGGYVNIDQPRLRDCLPPTAQVFGTTAYVRLHGRNAATWFARGLPSFERYNYLYSTVELEEWAGRIRQMLAQARDVYVFANNHYNGQGVANALELRALLEGGPWQFPVPADHAPIKKKLAFTTTPLLFPHAV
jgi:uncharacterized protein YecE (DUF72 family)